jgi:hypothetical protein
MRSDEYATVAGLDEVAPAFVAMANRMVYCTLATVDRRGRPRSRIVHKCGRGTGRRWSAGSAASSPR